MRKKGKGKYKKGKLILSPKCVDCIDPNILARRALPNAAFVKRSPHTNAPLNNCDAAFVLQMIERLRKIKKTIR